jgi:hypothetical protein
MPVEQRHEAFAPTERWLREIANRRNLREVCHDGLRSFPVALNL